MDCVWAWAAGGSLLSKIICQSLNPQTHILRFVFLNTKLLSLEFTVMIYRFHHAWVHSSGFRNTVTHRLLDELDYTKIASWSIIHVTKVGLEKLGLGLDNPVRTLFKSVRLNDRSRTWTIDVKKKKEKEKKKLWVGATPWYHRVAEDSRIPKMLAINPLLALVHPQTQKNCPAWIVNPQPQLLRICLFFFVNKSADR
jgi:hypothetical protein